MFKHIAEKGQRVLYRYKILSESTENLRLALIIHTYIYIVYSNAKKIILLYI